MTFRIRSAGMSDPGLKRPANEDSMLIDDDQSLWVVADGMGGHKNGAFASSQAVGCLAELPFEEDFDMALQRTADCIYAANQQIWEAEGGSEARGTMGTTIVSLLIRGQRFAILWVGDSRAYIYRRGGLFRLSTDHTHVQDLVDQGMLEPSEAEHHPMAHVLSRALGVQETVQVDIVEDTLEPGDIFLLCSDGLTGPVSEDRIREIVSAHAPAEAVDKLIEAAHANGAPDNVSVALVAVESDS